MYDPEQKQFILKNSLGVSYHVYHENGRGLCVRMLGERRIWSRGYVLSDQAINDFFVTLDKDDIFHFIFQSMDGRILYGHGRHGQMEILPILSSKDPTPWPKHVSLLICGNVFLFFYTVRYQKRYLLSMQTLREGSLSKPSVIDYIDGPDIRYAPITGNSGKCHLIYTNRENSQSRLLHRVMQGDFSIFNAPRKIYTTDGDITNLSAIWPDGGHIHLLFQVSDENSSDVMYKNLSSDKSPEKLYSSISPPGYTGLVYSGGIINFFRITGEGIHGRISRNDGKSWSDEAVYPFGNTSSLTCFRYHTNTKKERLEFSSDEIPGTFSHGYQLAFLNNPVVPDKSDFYSYTHNGRGTSRLDGIAVPDSNATHPALENEKKTAVESPQLKDIQKKVLLLQNLTENMQRELTKLWLTQKDYDKKLNNLSRLYARLKDNMRSIPEYDAKKLESEIISNENPAWDETPVTEKTLEEDTGSNTAPDTQDDSGEQINSDYAD